MRQVKGLLPSALVAVLLVFQAGADVPAPTWSVDEASLEVGLDRVVILQTTTWSGDLAMRLRVEMDTVRGDHNGLVEPDEVASLQRTYDTDYAKDAPSCLSGFDAIRLDGKPSTALRSVRVRFINAPAGVHSTDPIQLVTRLVFDYPANPDAAAVASFALGSVNPHDLELGCGYAPLASSWTEETGPSWKRAKVQVTSAPRVVFVPDTAQPAELRTHWSAGGFLSPDRQAKEMLVGGPAEIRLANATPLALEAPTSVRDPGDMAARTLGGVILLLAVPGVALLSMPRLRRFLSIAAFSRIDKDRCLDHPARGRLLDEIAARPGSSLADLERATALGHATVLHHLRTLERNRLVSARRDAGRTRYYSTEAARTSPPRVTAVQGRFLEAVVRRPDATAQALAEDLGWSRRLVAYHARRLARMGRIVVWRLTGRHHYAAVLPLPMVDEDAPPPPTQASSPRSADGPPVASS